jgi:hypothetical protein
MCQFLGCAQQQLTVLGGRHVQGEGDVLSGSVCCVAPVIDTRQSRLVRFDREGYQLFTVDHNDDGSLRLDLQQDWNCATPPQPITPESELICDPSSGWLCSQLDCQLGGPVEGFAAGGDGAGGVQWLPAGPNCLLAVQDDILVEYDMEMRSPAGVVAFLQGAKWAVVGRTPLSHLQTQAVCLGSVEQPWQEPNVFHVF